jgi:crotonobetaine/carnitine-CoA ligase
MGIVLAADPQALTFCDWFRERSRQYADRPAIEIREITRTYSELDTKSDKLAIGYSDLGVRVGTRVAVMLDNSMEHIDSWIALGKLGAIEIPINTAYTGEILQYLIAHCDAEILVCDQRHLDVVVNLLPGLPLLKTVVYVPAPSPEETIEPNDSRVKFVRFGGLYLEGKLEVVSLAPSIPSVILYSSGTTGPPKGILHSNGGCVRLGRYAAELMGYEKSDVLWNCFPLFHQNARYIGVFPAIESGAKIVLETRFSASRFWENARSKNVTAFNYLGAVLLMLLRQPKELGDCDHSVTRALGAGAPRDIWPEFEQRFGVVLTEIYGLTEAPMATANRGSSRTQLSSGKPSGLFDVKVFGDDDRPSPSGEIGEIVIRPKVPWALMLGYDHAPEATISAFRNLWFHSGDRGWMSEDGELYFTDRRQDCIRRRGESISSWEIESVLARHPGIFESAAYGVPSELSEEEVMIALVALPGAVLDPAEVHLYCAEHLPRYAVPRYIRLVPSLPHTPTERVQKFVLRNEGVTPDTWCAPEN